jgi:hypothetical protein
MVVLVIRNDTRGNESQDLRSDRILIVRSVVAIKNNMASETFPRERAHDG